MSDKINNVTKSVAQAALDAKKNETDRPAAMNTPTPSLPSDKVNTRIAILQATVNILGAVDVPMHYTRLTAAIADQWSPAAGAKTKADYTVYSTLYENAQETTPSVVFLRSGVFGLKGKSYTAEQIKSAVPPRAARAGSRTADGRAVVVVPTTLTDEQKAALAAMGILLPSSARR
jgi:hypothetical protein